MFRDLYLYEIEVEYTHTTILREGRDGDYVGEEKTPKAKKTLRLITDRFYNDHRREDSEYGIMIEAWIANTFRFQEEQDFQILSVTSHSVNFLIPA